MKINKIKNYYKSIYIFFIFFSLIIFFFPTSHANSKAYNIENIEVSKPFEIKFDKNKVIDEGFFKAFEELNLNKNSSWHLCIAGGGYKQNYINESTPIKNST